jgi:sialic acid synthase SpsE
MTAKKIKIGRVVLGGEDNGGDGRPVPLIAELGIAHDGSIDKALRMADAALAAGAAIVKTQHHRPEEMTATHSKRDAILSRALGIEGLARLKKHVEQGGGEFLCTPFCPAAVVDLRDLGVHAYKIGSAEWDRLDIIDEMKGKPILVGCGMTEWWELGVVYRGREEMVPMHCVSRYPTDTRLANLGNIARLYGDFDVVGYSSHDPTGDSVLTAVALGAAIVEVHVCETLSDIDGESAIHLDELESLIRMVEITRQSMLERMPEVIGWARGKLVTRHAVRAGEEITEWDVMRADGDDGAEPFEETRYTAVRDLPAGCVVPGDAVACSSMQGK